MEIAHTKKKEVTDAASQQLVSISDYSSANKSASTFYFYNDAAISQGFSEFKRRWGNRKLEDNWRSSAASGTGPIKEGSAGYVAQAENNNFEHLMSRDSLRSSFVKDIPYSLTQKQESHEKVSKALYEIAVFYKETLKDEAESVEAFEAIIQNYPDDNNAANIYYQLYRLSAESDPKQSEIYKQKLISLFPNSDYAKAIVNPNYGKEKEFRINALKREYATTYDLYNEKKYKEVFSRLNDLKPRYSAFPDLQLQFSYLEALAIGHTQKTPMFLASLDRIVKTYPDDKTITPVIQHQMAFIAKNRVVFDQRPTALLAHDRNELNYNQPQIVFAPVTVEKPAPAPPVESKPQPEEKKVIAKVETPKAEVPVAKKQEPKPELPAEVVPTPIPEEVKEEVVVAVVPDIDLVPERPSVPEMKPEIIPEKPKGLEFSVNERQRHLIVIDISDPKQNIAQPFSKLSQYFYSKFEASTVQLIIRVVGGTEKFIIVSGDFSSKEAADEVAEELSKNLPKIMEGQTSQYRQFVVSQENLKLLTDKASIDQYLKSISPNK